MIIFLSGGALPYTKDMSMVKKTKWNKETVGPP